MVVKEECESRTVERSILRVGVYSLLVNISLVGTKFALSITAGSLALRADAIHSLVDVFGSLALILGLIISSRKSKSFPYGLYKVENVVAVGISLLLFLSAYEIVSEALTGEIVATNYGGWVIGVVALITLVPFFFGRYEVKAGKKHNSPSLIADGKQFKADVLSSIVVLIAVFGQRFGIHLDSIAAVVIAVFILKAGWGLLSGSMRVLLDASIDQDTLEKIRSVVKAEPAVSTVKSVTGRNSGRYLFVETEVALRISDLRKAQLVSERIETDIKNAIPHVDRVLVHFEPRSQNQLRYAVPLANTEGEISQHFGEAPYYTLVDIDLKLREVHKQEVLANPHCELVKGKGIKVAQFLLNYKTDVVVTKENLSGKGPGYAFADAGVETIQTKSNSLSDLLDQILKSLPSS